MPITRSRSLTGRNMTGVIWSLTKPARVKTAAGAAVAEAAEAAAIAVAAVAEATAAEAAVHAGNEKRLPKGSLF